MILFEQFPTFSLSRDIAFPGGLGRARPGSGTIWSADFRRGLYRRNDRMAALTDTVAAARASDALMQAADGGYALFGSDEAPVLPGMGLEIWGGFENRVVRSQAFDDGAWTKRKSGVGLVPQVTSDAGRAPDGTMCADRIVLDNHGGSSATDYSQVLQTVGIGEGQTSFFVKSNTDDNYDVALLAYPGLEVFTVTPEWRRISTPFGATATSTSLILRGGYGTSDVADMLVWQADVVSGAFMVPPVPTGAEAASRAPTDATIPGFDTLARLHNLEAGFAGTDTIQLTRLFDTENRCIWWRGSDADNGIRLDVTPANKLRLTIRHMGVEALVLETADAFADTGEKTIGYVCADGAWRLWATGLSAVSDPGSYPMPGLSVGRIGSGVENDNYLNGALLESRIEAI